MVGIFSCLLQLAFAQADTSLKTYFVTSKLDEECSADIVVTLFDESLKMDNTNELILDELMRGFYDTRQSAVNLRSFYAKRHFDPTGEFLFTIGAECTFHKNGVYSFVACPYNVCEKVARSTFESNCVTIDLKTGKILGLDDIIDPVKRDSFDNYVYYTATRYHIRNLPSCYISSFNPVNLRGSNNVSVQTDSVTYLKGLTDKYYLEGDKLYVYNKAIHRAYVYNSVEVMLTFYYLKYFLKPDMIGRLGML